jgi:hypothetical protein
MEKALIPMDQTQILQETNTAVSTRITIDMGKALTTMPMALLIEACGETVN